MAQGRTSKAAAPPGPRSRRPARRPGPGWIVGAATAALVIAAVAKWHQYEHKVLTPLETAWNIDGQPCPRLAASEYANAGFLARERTTAFEYLEIGRMSGHMSCRSVPLRGTFGFVNRPICQFTSPNALRLRVGDAEFYFRPPPGSRATLSYQNGVARCVLNGRLTLTSDPT